MTKKRCLVLIDGSNFYFKLKELKLHHLLNFDFGRFMGGLAGTDQIAKAIYYVGAVRTDGTEKAQKMFNEQRKLFVHLKRQVLSPFG